jgi:polysaccharide biosynthesis transport protein
VGEIARLPLRAPANGSLPGSRIGRDLGLFEESIDSLRTSLVLAEPLRDVKVLAVTSAANSEGKTSVSLQLAVSIARASGQRTLLIDGDLRSPDVHRVLQTRLTPGLAEVLGHECSVQDAIVTSWSEHVHVLPAGKLAASPHKLLGNGALKAVLDELRGSYRYIVIDTPPVLPASEALVLARAADATLICAMRDTSRIDQVRKTYDRLLAAGACPVGMVLNGVPSTSYAYRYGEYYARSHDDG